MGTKITVRRVISGHSIEQTTYWQPDRKRMEYRNSSGDRLGPRLAAVIRCDLGKIFELNLDSSEYVSAPYPPLPLTREEMRARGLDGRRILWSEKPLLRIETKTVDTGERKQLFGHTARHVITTRTQTPLQGSNSQPQESVRDGWYIDLNQQISCDSSYMPPGRVHANYYDIAAFSSHSFGSQANKDDVMEKPEFVNIGKPEMGFALEALETSTSAYKSADGTTRQASSKDQTIVTDLKEGALDPALFQIPHGFRQVKEIERNPPPLPLNPVRQLWERLKYTVSKFFSVD